MNKNILEHQINYEAEYQYNSSRLALGLTRLNSDYKRASLAYNLGEVISSVRVAELLNSATQDIIRYARYHPIMIDEHGSLAISESVRAAYLTKWILIFKPLNLDQDLPDLNQIQNVEKAARDTGSTKPSIRFDLLFHCNEYLALAVASCVLQLKIDGKITSILNYLTKTNCGTAESLKNEIDTLLYNFRYRIKHQDVYHLFYNRLLHSCAV